MLYIVDEMPINASPFVMESRAIWSNLDISLEGIATQATLESSAWSSEIETNRNAGVEIASS